MIKTTLGEDSTRPYSIRQRLRSMPKLPAILVATVLLVGLGFVLGVEYQKNQRVGNTSNTATNQLSNAGQQRRQAGQNGFGRRFGGQRPVTGQVTSVSSSSISINDQAGTARTFAVTENTIITDQGQPTALSTIKVGDTIGVVVDTSDGQKAARILLNTGFGTAAPSSTNGSNSTSIN